jgi:hypothetical protein
VAEVQAEPAEIAILGEAFDQDLRRDSREGQVEAAGQAMFEVAIEMQSWHPSRQTRQQPVSATAQSSGLLCHFRTRDRRGAAEPDAERRGQGTGPQPRSWPPPSISGNSLTRGRRRTKSAPNPFWAANLVSRDQQQIDLHRFDIERDLGLGCIAVKQNALGTAQRANLGERLDHADLSAAPARRLR